MGDTHGSYKGLRQALERAGFIHGVDTLIVLGDTQDGWSQAPELMEYYIGFSETFPGKLIYLLGNHDEAFITWWDQGCERHIMHGHGGRVTTVVYTDTDVISRHAEWLRMQRKIYRDDKGRIFVHAGWNPGHEWDNPGQLSFDEYTWNRSFWDGMYQGRNFAKNHPMVFLGHSPTTRHGKGPLPMKRRNVWNLDTGAAFMGKVTVMDVDTEEYWQSDVCQDLYPLERGRN